MAFRPRPWHVLVGAPVALLLLVALCIAWWLASDGDLRRVDARARESGLPTTWEELGLRISPDERRTAYETLVASTPPKSWRRGTAPETARIAMGEPVPEALREWHRGRDAAQIARTLAMVDALGDQPLVMTTRFVGENHAPGLSTLLNLGYLLEERILIAEPVRAREEVERMARFCRALPIGSPVQAMLREAVLDRLANAVLYRRDALAGDPAVVDALVAARIALTESAPLSRRAWFVERRVTLASDDGCRGMAPLLTGVPPWLAWTRPMLVRAGREELLLRMLATIALERQPQHLRQQLRSRVWKADRTTPRRLLANAYAVVPYAPTENAGPIIRCDLAIAEITGTPWSPDPCSADGSPLRVLVRDGVRIGAYSVGADGIDQDGEGDDRHFAIWAEVPRKAP